MVLRECRVYPERSGVAVSEVEWPRSGQGLSDVWERMRLCGEEERVMLRKADVWMGSIRAHPHDLMLPLSLL